MKFILEGRMLSPLFVKDFTNFMVRECQFIWINPIQVPEENYIVIFDDPEYGEDDIGYVGEFKLVYEAKSEEDAKNKANELIMEVEYFGNFTYDGQGRVLWTKGYFTEGVDAYGHFQIRTEVTERKIAEFTINEEITEIDISDQIPAAIEAWQNYAAKERKRQEKKDQDPKDI